MSEGNETQATWRSVAWSLILASRPVGWVAALALLRTGMLYGRAPESWATVGLSVAVTFPFCLYLFGLNDLADADSDRVNPRKGNWIHGSAGISQVWRGLVRRAPWLAGLFVIVWLPWLPWRASVLMTFVLGIAWAYSSPPFRLKEVPIIDGLVTAAIMVGLLGVGYWLNPDAGAIEAEAWAVAPTLAGLHIFASVADESSDRLAGHRTLAVRAGGKVAGGVAVGLSLLGTATIPFLDYAEPIAGYMVLQSVVMGAWWLVPKLMTMRRSMIVLGTAGIVTLVYMAAVYTRCGLVLWPAECW